MNDEQEMPEVPADDGKLVERINKGDLKPLFDSNHEHVMAIDDEKADNYVAYKCTKCELGYLVQKT